MHFVFYINPENGELVKAEFAEQLERELTAMTEQRDAQAERIRYLEGATNHANGIPLTKAIEQRDRLAEALQKLADCDWLITLPNRMDAVRTIANEALKCLTNPNEL